MTDGKRHEIRRRSDQKQRKKIRVFVIFLNEKQKRCTSLHTVKKISTSCGHDPT